MNRDHGNDSGDQEREDQRWRDHEADIIDERRAVEAFFDACDAAEDSHRSVTYYDRDSGEVDAQASEIVAALLAAGWTLPRPAPAADEPAF